MLEVGGTQATRWTRVRTEHEHVYSSARSVPRAALRLGVQAFSMYIDRNYEMVKLIEELPQSVQGAHKHEHAWYRLPALCFEQMCLREDQKTLV